jgi:hypothetical protein
MMKMESMRHPFWFLILVSIAALTSAAHAFEPSTDELGVYRALFSSEQLVVLRETGIVAEMDPAYASQLAPFHDSFVADIQKRFPTAEPSTIESYSKKRNVLTLLTPKFDIGVRISMLDSDTYRKLYPGMGAVTQTARFREKTWSAFLWRYRGARAVTYITRVGFNTKASQALVFIQETTGAEIGDSRYAILLDHQNGTWAITKKDKEQ